MHDVVGASETVVAVLLKVFPSIWMSPIPGQGPTGINEVNLRNILIA